MFKKQVCGEGLCWQRASVGGFLSSPTEVLSVGAVLRLTRAERHLVFWLSVSAVQSPAQEDGPWAVGYHSTPVLSQALPQEFSYSAISAVNFCCPYVHVFIMEQRLRGQNVLGSRVGDFTGHVVVTTHEVLCAKCGLSK